MEHGLLSNLAAWEDFFKLKANLKQKLTIVKKSMVAFEVSFLSWNLSFFDERRCWLFLKDRRWLQMKDLLSLLLLLLKNV